ncbi:MAG: histidine kinase, partial [Flavobacterium sp.]
MNFFYLFIFLYLFSLSPVVSKIKTEQQEDSLIHVLSKVKDDSLKMDTYNKLRKVTYYSNPINSEKYALKYLEYAQKTADSLNTAIANFFMGNANIVNGNAHLAIDYYLKSAHYFENVNYDPSRLSSVYNGIASAYENLYNDSLSLVYYQKSFDLSKRENDNKRMGIALVNMSNVMERKGDYEKVINLLNQAEKMLLEKGSEMYLKAVYVNLISAYIQTNQIVKAEKLINVESPKADKEKDMLMYSKIIENKGRLLVKKRDVMNGLKLLNEAFELYSKNGFLKEKINLYPELIEANYKSKNYKTSSDLQFEFNTIKDSIFTQEKNKSLAEALQKYESEKKDKLLLENQLEINRKNTQKKFITYGLIVVIAFMIGGFLFFMNRLKYVRTIQKQQQELQSQQIVELNQKNKLTALNSMLEGQEKERIRIAKDLHDSLGGLLSNIKTHFSKLNSKSEPNYLIEVSKNTSKLIDEACIEVRRISH